MLAAASTSGTVGAREVFPDKNVYLAVLFSLFLHGSILHVLGNMLFLWVFGNNVEDRLGPDPVSSSSICSRRRRDRGARRVQHGIDGADDRRVGRDRGRDGRVHRLVAARDASSA